MSAQRRIAELRDLVNLAADLMPPVEKSKEFFREFRRLLPGDFAALRDACDGNDPQMYKFLCKLEADGGAG
ncbi:MAG: hypothetical protein HRF49_07530 [bacterium]|jgi:hypothetical protein